MPTILLYAVGYPIGSATVAVMSPFLVILLRFLGSSLVLWVLLALRGVGLPDRRRLLHATVAGVLTQGVQFTALYWGLANGVSSGLGALIIALNPVATALILATTTGHRESRQGLAALGAGTLAVVLACAPRIASDSSIGPSVLVVVLAMLGLSAGGVHQSRFCSGMDPMLVTAIGVTASIPVAALATVSAPTVVTDWPRAAALLVAMVLLTSVGATTLYAACVRRAGARAASIVFAVVPAVASLFAWAAFGEALTVLSLLALVLGATACVLQARAGQQASVRTHPSHPSGSTCCPPAFTP